jgi:hypothetical protein
VILAIVAIVAIMMKSCAFKVCRFPLEQGINMTESTPNKTVDTMSEETNLLEDDYLTVPGQLYACLSFVSPTSAQKADQLAMKIRGIFATEVECKAHIQKLQKLESVSVDIYVAPLYKWLVIPPNPDTVQDQHYQEQFLEDLMTGYKDSQDRAKEHFVERKKKVLEEGLDKHLEPSEVIPKIDENVHPIEQGQPSGSQPGGE